MYQVKAEKVSGGDGMIFIWYHIIYFFKFAIARVISNYRFGAAGHDNGHQANIYIVR
jgi:hypothetical protein